jgi:ATP phosphoribosyltransferase regulatory subunit
VVSNDRSRRALDNLHQMLDILEVYGVAEDVTFDLGELRGLDYHTGVTFQGFLSGMGRAVCVGGRYDNLTARYGFPAPATGFAFNLLNLLFALDKNLDEVAAGSTDILIFQAGTDKKQAQRLARALREQGISAARDIIPRDLQATIEYAQKMSFRHLLIITQGGEQATLLRLADRLERTILCREILAGHFTLTI